MLAVLERDGKLVAFPARRGARRVGRHGAARPARARRPRAGAARARGRAAAGAAAEGRHETYTAEKAAIARAVADVVADARVLLIDGSTTNLEVARLLPGTRVGTVLTNSPPIAAALADHPTVEVVVIGGRLDKRAQVTVGASAVDAIRAVRADACVLGVCALRPEVGLAATTWTKPR